MKTYTVSLINRKTRITLTAKAENAKEAMKAVKNDYPHALIVSVAEHP